MIKQRATGSECRQVLKRVVLGLIAIIAVLSLLVGLQSRVNFHVVIPEQVYRSAQLDAYLLGLIIDKKHIRSIINLRGQKPQENWYSSEVALSNRMGVRHYNVEMSAYGMPSPETLQKLVSILETAPRPVLIHCEGGADRTGLASAIVLLLANKPLALAKQQISLLYFAVRKKSVGKLVLPMYAEWLNKNKLESSRDNWIRWVNQR